MIKILVVDQAAESCCSVRQVLPESGISGFTVDFRFSYREILEGFRGTYDLCVIDSACGNGPRLFAQARSLGFMAPVILVTSDDAREAVSAIRSGVADCLVREDLTAAGIERLICSVVELAREAAQEFERARRYLALVDNADEVIFTHDLNGNCTSMNTTAAQLTGYSQEELLHLPVLELVAPSHRETVRQMIRETLSMRCQTSCEIEIVTKQGQTLFFEGNSHLVYHQGRAVEVQWRARKLGSTNQSPRALFQGMQLHSSASSKDSQNVSA